MPTLKGIKKRILSVKNTQKITRAMKLVSAAKLKRATDRVQGSRPYERELRDLVSTILRETQWQSGLMEIRSIKKIGFVVLSTDRGLCGSLNTNIIKTVTRRVNELNTTPFELICIGRRIRDYARRRGWETHFFWEDLLKKGDFQYIQAISKKIQELFLSGHVDRVEIFYNRFQSALVQKSVSSVFLPFCPGHEGESRPYLFEPSPRLLLEALVPKLVDFQLYQCVLESVASEHGARMSAMESATQNARDMIGSLTLQRNRMRQAAITKELMEIIGGAEALSA